MIWRDLAIGVLAVLLTIVGYMYTSLDNQVNTLVTGKVDKDAYYRDLGEIKTKLDTILMMHVDGRARGGDRE